MLRSDASQASGSCWTRRALVATDLPGCVCAFTPGALRGDDRRSRCARDTVRFLTRPQRESVLGDYRLLRLGTGFVSPPRMFGVAESDSTGHPDDSVPVIVRRPFLRSRDDSRFLVRTLHPRCGETDSRLSSGVPSGPRARCRDTAPTADSGGNETVSPSAANCGTGRPRVSTPGGSPAPRRSGARAHPPSRGRAGRRAACRPPEPSAS